MTVIETIQIFDTEYSADSVEWLNSNDNVFVLGTYQLEEKDEATSSNKSIRKGRIYLFNFEISNQTLEKLQQIETDAVLDQKWMDHNLVVATSVGNIEFYHYDKTLKFEHKTLIPFIDGSENLILSLDTNKENGKISSSDSNGQISLIDFNTQTVQAQWKAHDFEAWTCAFNRWNPYIIFSGEYSIQ